MTAAAGWRLERRQGAASHLHRPWPAEADLSRRALAVCTVSGPPALVLGSAQRLDLADAARLEADGVELVQRASGGGAVLVGPGAQVWIDAWVPAGDALWSDDIIRGPQWLGDAWAAGLASLGVADVFVHRGRLVGGEWSSMVCFAGMGPGEVAHAGAKVVGLSQRRTRHGVRMSTMAVVDWDPLPLARLLALPDEDRRRMGSAVAGAAAGLRALVPFGRVRPGEVPLADVVADAVLGQLPQGE